MKTRKHGNGLNHKEVVNFSNRLATMAHRLATMAQNEIGPDITFSAVFNEGYAAACKYFAHELRKLLRESEKYNEERR